MTDPLAPLGQFAASQEPSEMEVERRIVRVRARFQDALDTPRVSPGGLRIGLAAALVAAVVSFLVFARWAESDRRLEVHAEASSQELTGSVVRSGAGTKQLNFTDGTRLSLHPDTTVVVERTTPRGATLNLRQGRTFASIVPSRQGRWRFRAGPYLVRVTGTEFELEWKSDEGTIELAMHRGSVVLTGPNVVGELVVEGSEFVRFRASGEMSGPSQDKRANADSPLETEAEPLSGEATSDEEDDTAAEAESGQGLASAAPLTAQQLWKQVREHRTSGNGTAARDALVTLRSQYGAVGQTAYLLGRVHADLLGQRARAVHWFETYLKESPGGSLSGQALGRLIELQAGTDAGGVVAKRYLAHYPDGPYARLARSALR